MLNLHLDSETNWLGVFGDVCGSFGGNCPTSLWTDLFDMLDYRDILFRKCYRNRSFVVDVVRKETVLLTVALRKFFFVRLKNKTLLLENDMIIKNKSTTASQNINVVLFRPHKMKRFILNTQMWVLGLYLRPRPHVHQYFKMELVCFGLQMVVTALHSTFMCEILRPRCRRWSHNKMSWTF